MILTGEQSHQEIKTDRMQGFDGMEGSQTSANVSLKEMRWPSFSVSTSTPSQSKSSAAGRAAEAGAPPAPAADAWDASAARRDLLVEKRREHGDSLLPPTLLGRHWAAVHGTGRAVEMVLAGSNVEEDEAAAAMASFGRETMWIARLVAGDRRLGFDGKFRHTTPLRLWPYFVLYYCCYGE